MRVLGARLRRAAGRSGEPGGLGRGHRAAERPIEHASGALLRSRPRLIDAGGHRTEAVKAFVRSRRVRRPMAIFGAIPNNAPVLSKGKLQDVNWRGQMDKRGVLIHHVGTVAVKHLLFSRLSTDAEKQADARLVHFSDELPPEYFTGLVSETYNPAKNRFDKRRGARNEPLDTWVYSYAATHHPELRLHRASKVDWDAREARPVKHQRDQKSPRRQWTKFGTRAPLLAHLSQHRARRSGGNGEPTHASASRADRSVGG
jgi:phage terminase large subunit GpA-like protein